MRRLVLLLLALAMLLAACVSPTTTPRPIGPTATQRPFPTFGPTRTRTPTRTPRVSVTSDVAPTIESTATPTWTPTSPVSHNQPIGLGATQKPIATLNPLARASAPSILLRALIDAGVRDPKVYWFTFDEGDREQALMIQYASPLRWQAGYLDMLRAAKLVLGRYYLSIDPPLYSAFIAATDITGASDITVRLRRHNVEKYARGDAGADDFVNNYFEFVNVVLRCTSGGGCTAKMATPFPEFNFPFPFPTPTIKP